MEECKASILSKLKSAYIKCMKMFLVIKSMTVLLICCLLLGCLALILFKRLFTMVL